jgi:hypothetical protein
MPPSLREYDAAEERIRESIELRAYGLDHDYPDRGQDLGLMRAFHAEHGYPPPGFFRRLLWYVRGGGGIR